MGPTAQKWVIEAKVIAASAVTFAVSTAVAVLNEVQADHDLLGSTPAPLQFAILALIPTALTFLGGFTAKHTSRTLPPPQ